MLRHFDLDALRCFVLGIELGSFALAAKQLHRSTSAASAQLKKLEIACDVKLVSKVGRHLEPTAEGELLLSYAKRLLALNDEATLAIGARQLPGKLRFGMQEDFSEAFVPDILAQFSRTHPQVQLSVHVGRNKKLLKQIQQNELDFSLSWVGEQTPPYSEPLGKLPLCWIATSELTRQNQLLNTRPLPLVMFESPCLMRQKATQTLDNAGIPWRIVFESSNLSSIWKAVGQGLGMTVRTPYAMPDDVKPISTTTLGELGHIGLRLDSASNTLTDVAQRFRDQLVTKLSLQLAPYQSTNEN
ncbi:LysR substrate-binding domain-containing protein [Celerinatantimonas sp. MCCC 1A17872]|uniref:LysR substrate-binding domain-containing protein n=1 Tax=Celerinatantimonas sp. MCCC 1A17872 TaxID=3177514 RepID=UPI0038C2D0D6